MIIMLIFILEVKMIPFLIFEPCIVAEILQTVYLLAVLFL